MAEVSYETPEHGEARSASDGKVKTALVRLKETVNGKIGQANFEANAALAGKWYAPKEIATEESTSSTSFTTLTTKDELTGIAVPAGGIIRVRYVALWKANASAGGAALVFLNGKELSSFGQGQGAFTSTSSNQVEFLGTTGSAESTRLPGLATYSGTHYGEFGNVIGTPIDIVPPSAGTYAVSIRFKANVGTITVAVKERKLWAEVLGT